MLVKIWFQGCDMCGGSHNAKQSYVAQGATGRWCPVLSVCDDCVPEGETVLTIQQAYDKIDTLTGWPEF